MNSECAYSAFLFLRLLTATMFDLTRRSRGWIWGCRLSALDLHRIYCSCLRLSDVDGAEAAGLPSTLGAHRRHRAPALALRVVELGGVEVGGPVVTAHHEHRETSHTCVTRAARIDDVPVCRSCVGMPTQTVTEPPEEEMPDADESRKDEEGNVMTYEQVLLKCANDEDLAGAAWDMMSAASIAHRMVAMFYI